jgi:asparagine synthase (glutamine-hydrolysing)
VGDLAAGNLAYLKAFFGRGLEAADQPTFSHELRWANTSRLQRLFAADFHDGPARTDRTTAARQGLPTDLHKQLRLPAEFDGFSPLAKAQFLEATIFLPEYLLCSQGDRMGMAHSVEGRFPFLDHRVVEFCNRIRPSWKLCGLSEKHVLRKAATGLIPVEILRRPKQPYRAPIEASFFPHGEPLDWVSEELSATAVAAAGYFHPAAVARLVGKLERFGTLSEMDGMALTGVLSTQLLHRAFVSGRPETVPLNQRDDVKYVLRGTVAETAVVAKRR